MLWQLLHQPIETLLWCHVVSVWVSMNSLLGTGSHVTRTCCGFTAPPAGGSLTSWMTWTDSSAGLWTHDVTSEKKKGHLGSVDCSVTEKWRRGSIGSEPPEPSVVTDVWSIYNQYSDLIFTPQTVKLQPDSDSTAEWLCIDQLIVNWSAVTTHSSDINTHSLIVFRRHRAKDQYSSRKLDPQQETGRVLTASQSPVSNPDVWIR